MDYARSSITALLRGPLLFTPQGWVVLTTLVLCWIGAVFAWGTGNTYFFSGELDRVLMIMGLWPLSVFLFYVRLCSPHFQPSWNQAGFIAIAALSLPAYEIFLH